MKLNEWPTQRQRKPSVVDTLPDDVREQLVAARLAGSHSVSAMIEWLRSEGYDQVTPSMLSCWFLNRGVKAGAGSGDA